MNIDIDSLSAEELKDLVAKSTDALKKKDLGNFLSNKDNLRKVIMSDAFLGVLKDKGYNLNAEDVVDVLLPKYTEVLHE